MSSAVEVLNSSVKMLKLLRKAQVEIESRRFYHALRTIDEIQLNHLRSVQDFNFAQVIKVKLPEMKIKIKNLVLGEMKDWLSRVREDSKSVGELAVKLANARKERLKSKTEEMQRKSSYAISSVLELLVIEELECK
jgi:DNA gyrase/topoisomerase IV subunit B